VTVGAGGRLRIVLPRLQTPENSHLFGNNLLTGTRGISQLHLLFEAKNRLLRLYALHTTCFEFTSFRVVRPAVCWILRQLRRLLVPFTLEARPEVLAYDRTSPCTNSRRPKSLPSLPDLPAPSSSWRDETGGLVTLSRASDAENTRSDVCLQILPAFAKGMFRRMHSGPT
jgi:hypothetical protein